MTAANNNQRSRFSPTLVSLVAALVLLGAVGWMVVHEHGLQRPQKLAITDSGAVDMCLSCHTKEKLDTAHDAKVIGCAVCHLGNRLAITKEEGHNGMVNNPGDLRWINQTCAVEGCHPVDEHKVKNSLMATNRGIIGTLTYYWGEGENQNSELTVEQLIKTGQTSFALDYFRKLCATCHLWKQKNDLQGIPQFFNEKGGGCSACHVSVEGQADMHSVLVADSTPVKSIKKEDRPHPQIIKKVTSMHCIRCHNRSGRIGLSYMGLFESEGYGTPYEKGGLNSRQLPGERFYLELADDIHHNKGMECIDCHTRDEIMGDGTSYAHYEEQVEISCQVCHSAQPGKTRKGKKLTNMEVRNGKTVLTGKVDGRVHPVNPAKAGVCDFPAHKRMTCDACHSTWVAQCYGCHVKKDVAAQHLDKLNHQQTEGLWEEGRSYIRYEQPMLAVWKNEIVVVTPGCQDVVTVVGKDRTVEKSFNSFTMAAINPHTTQAKGRPCNDCHGSTKTVGLGEGRLAMENGKLTFTGIDQGIDTSAGRTVPFDAYVTLDGTPLQKSARSDLRPFNGDELKKILRVGFCIRCHERYTDPLWTKYSADSVCKRASTKDSEQNALLKPAEVRK